MQDPFSLTGILRNAIAAVEEKAREKSIRLTVDIEPALSTATNSIC